MFSRRLRYPVIAIVSVILCSLACAAKTKEGPAYQKWLNEDVRWIITPQERAQFQKLSTDQQRDDFIVAFWERRDPTPGTPENEFKEEHYQRLAFANQHFAANIPGWESDRGRIYIVYGPPDSIEVHGPESHGLNILSSGASRAAAPFMIWHYRRLANAPQGQSFKVVDKCQCGEYKLEGAR